MDDVYMPYFCIINDDGDVLYTLAMNPQITIIIKKS